MTRRALLCIWLCLLYDVAHAQDARNVMEPVIPPMCAVLLANTSSPMANPQADDTARIQQAIGVCPAGHAVRLAAGNGNAAFLSGPLALKSGVVLLVDTGVTLYAATNPLAYDKGGHRCGTNDKAGRGCTPFISADDTEGSGIMGEGVIDGQGGHLIDGQQESWWQIARRAQREDSRQNVPRLLEVNRSRNFTLYGITLVNSANFHVTLNQVDGFTAWGVRIDTPADARNTDGIDPISSRNVTITHSFIRTGDDNVAIKAGRLGAAENISILHNHFYSGHGMSIGSETEGGVRHVLVDDLSMAGTTSGLRIKSDVSRGGAVNDVTYRSVCLRDVRAPLDFDTHYDPHAVGDRVPVFSSIVLQRVHSLTPGRVILRGLDEAHPLSFSLDNVHVDGLSAQQFPLARTVLTRRQAQPMLAVEYVQFDRVPGNAQAENCEGRFAPFPARAAIASADRPQLSDAQAAAYAYAEVMNYAAASGNKTADPWDPLTDPLATGVVIEPDYVVDPNADPDGKTRFSSVQSAVSHAVSESGRRKRVVILVKPGDYRELVYVPEFSAPITLIGGDSDASRTRIVADLDANVAGERYQQKFGAQFANVAPPIAAMYDSLKNRDRVGTPGSAIAWIRNRGFQAKNVSFENTYNRAHGDNFAADGTPAVHSQAVALMVEDADKAQFENVRFSSYQDTLFLNSSKPANTMRSFFHRSYIEGDLDFVFGEATAYFYRSEIKSLGDRRVSYAVAPDTNYESKFGFVFDACKFTHDNSPNALAGKFYLARQWFHNQKCTPYGAVMTPPGYRCEVGAGDAYTPPAGTISKVVLETVGKVIILNSRIGAHIDKSHPWSDWNAAGGIRHRPVQYSSDDFWRNLLAAGIDPLRQLGYAGPKNPVEPFLAEHRNIDE